jgi:hypothetical protein
MIVVRHHKGRRGKSVYVWRVYRQVQDNGRTRQFQLSKYRTEAAANTAAEFYRNRLHDCREVG